MRPMKPAVKLLLAVATLLPSSLLAAVPDFVTYSGRLTDGTAWGQSTTIALTLRIYGQADGGTALWEQSFPSVAIEDGYFSVMLGTGTNPADGKALNVSAVFGAHDQTWITVCVGAGCTPDNDMKPRQQVGSVPYAMKAENARNAGDFNVAGTLTVGGHSFMTFDLHNLDGNESRLVGTFEQGAYANYLRVVAFGGANLSYVEKVCQTYNSSGNAGNPKITTIAQYGLLDVSFEFSYVNGKYLVAITVKNTDPGLSSGYTTRVTIEAVPTLSPNS